ncbi:response regulator [Ramlibacter sp. MAHUQ-53]|uniref:response regulator n=1 Tax=unclassified Ramlibacter TaxID=2617605 RepID=UPI00362B2E7D
MSDPIRLMVVDDHTLFRRGLTALLSQDDRFEVVGQAGDVSEAWRLLNAECPDVMLLDNHLPGVNGVDAIISLKQTFPDLRVMMLTVSEDEHDLARALQNGADGYLLKTAETDHLCDAIVSVFNGQSVISPNMMGKLVAALRQPAAAPDAAASAAEAAPAGAGKVQVLDKLSPREREIFLLVARSLSNKQIARDLDIAETTVKIHIQHIFRKLGLSSRVQIAVFAASSGLA